MRAGDQELQRLGGSRRRRWRSLLGLDDPQVCELPTPGANPEDKALLQRIYVLLGKLPVADAQREAKEALAAMLDQLELFGMGWSWGGYAMMWLEGQKTRFKALAASDFSGPLGTMNA